MHPEMMASSRGGDTACPQQPAITTSSGCGGAYPAAGGAGGPKQAERTSKSSVFKNTPSLPRELFRYVGALESRCHFFSESSIATAEI